MQAKRLPAKALDPVPIVGTGDGPLADGESEARLTSGARPNQERDWAIGEAIGATEDPSEVTRIQ